MLQTRKILNSNNLNPEFDAENKTKLESNPDSVAKRRLKVYKNCARQTDVCAAPNKSRCQHLLLSVILF